MRNINKFLATILAIGLISFSAAAAIPLQTGPVDPSGWRAVFNSLIISLNGYLNGTTSFGSILTPSVGFTGSTSGTTTVQASATASGTLTLPAATDTLADLAGTQTLTNKTLTSAVLTTPSMTSPTITSGALTFPTARTGTFVCTSGGSIVVSNTNWVATSLVLISLNTPGGTVSTAPAVSTGTASTSFTAKCATSDTSTYNYTVLN